ncbi:MAG: hypothetical protein U9O87_08405 [Verrucomicrobiota bacterium]|nr:hypothetical protein [Verrucomicrobiota bacterium]
MKQYLINSCFILSLIFLSAEALAQDVNAELEKFNSEIKRELDIFIDKKLEDPEFCKKYSIN